MARTDRLQELNAQLLEDLTLGYTIQVEYIGGQRRCSTTAGGWTFTGVDRDSIAMALADLAKQLLRRGEWAPAGLDEAARLWSRS